MGILHVIWGDCDFVYEVFCVCLIWGTVSIYMYEPVMVSLSEQKHSTRWFLTAHFLHVLISTTFIYCIIWVSCAVTLCDKLGKIFFPATVHWGLVFQCCIICVVSQKPAIILYFATVFLAKQSTERQRGSDRKLGLSETCLQPFAMEFPRLNRLQSEPILKWEGIDQYKNWLRTEKSVSLENDRTDTWTWELGPLALFPEDFLIWSNSNLVTTVLNLDTLPSCHWACRRPGRAFCSFTTTGGILLFCVRLWPCCVTDRAACQRRWIQRAYRCVLWAQQQPLSRRCYVSLGRGT